MDQSSKKTDRPHGAAVLLPVSVDLTELGSLLRVAVRETIREELAALRSAAPVDGLTDKSSAARALQISNATLDRAAREPTFPVHIVGNRRRYNVAEVRAWFDARGRKPTTPTASASTRVDSVTESMLERVGLRVIAGGGR